MVDHHHSVCDDHHPLGPPVYSVACLADAHGGDLYGGWPLGCVLDRQVFSVGCDDRLPVSLCLARYHNSSWHPYGLGALQNQG